MIHLVVKALCVVLPIGAPTITRVPLHQMAVILSLIQTITINFTVYDSNFVEAHQTKLALEGNGVRLEGASDATGFVQFSSDELVEGDNYTVRLASDTLEEEFVIVTATKDKCQSLIFELKNKTATIHAAAQQMTLRFTIYDVNFNQTHAVQLALQAEDKKILRSSNKNGIAEFVAQFEPGKEYALQITSDIFSDEQVKFVAQPDMNEALYLHPHFPLQVNLVPNSKGYKTQNSSVDVFCGQTNVSSGKFIDQIATIFIKRQFQECKSISSYGLFPHNPDRIFQEKLYEVKADVVVSIKPDPLIFIKLLYVERIKLVGDIPGSRPIANLQVNLSIQISEYPWNKLFFTGLTNRNGELTYLSTDYKQFPQSEYIHIRTSEDQTHFASETSINIVYDQKKEVTLGIDTIKMVNLTFNTCKGNTNSNVVLYNESKVLLNKSGQCSVQMSRNETVFVIGKTYKVKATMDGQFPVVNEFKMQPEAVIDIKWGLSIGGTIGLIVGLLAVGGAVAGWALFKKRNQKPTKSGKVRQSEKQSLINQNSLL